MEHLSPPGWELLTFVGVVAIGTVVHEVTKWLIGRLLAAARK